MGDSKVEFFDRPKMEVPILIEGLAGLGYVGKLTAEHLVEELGAKKFAKISSPYFPHHVSIDSDGVIHLMKDYFYHVNAWGRDMIILTGDVQATTSRGHYDVVNKILDVAESFGVERIFSLGGYATGRYPKGEPKVVGVVNSPELLEEYKDKGLVVEESAGSIIGASGLLLGLGLIRKIKGICLLGETHGVLVDPRSARSVLKTLCSLLGFEVDLTDLEKRAEEIEALLRRIGEFEEFRERLERREKGEKVSYIM